MFKPSPPPEEDLALTEDQRQAIWFMDASTSRVLPTSAIYQQWYRKPIAADSLPAAMGRQDWWPHDGAEYVADMPLIAQEWLDSSWPSMAVDFEIVAALCAHYRAKHEVVADILTNFWQRHFEAARALFLARQASHLLFLDDPEIDTVPGLRELLDAELQEVLDDSAAWEEHVEWFLTGGIRRYAPSPQAEDGEGGAASAAATDAPAP